MQKVRYMLRGIPGFNATADRNEVRFRWVVAAMVLALLGLLGLQVYLVLRVQRQQAHQFQLAVMASLQATASHLEMEEARRSLRLALEPDVATLSGQGTVSQISCPVLDSLGTQTLPIPVGLPVEGNYAVVRSGSDRQLILANPDPLQLEQYMHGGKTVTYFEYSSSTDQVGCQSSCHSGGAHAASREALGAFQTKTLTRQDVADIYLHKLRLRLNNLEDLLAKLANETPLLESRIDTAQIAFLLDREFQQNGIDQVFEWWIEPPGDPVAFASLASRLKPSRPLPHHFSTALFPNDLHPSGARLFVGFPSSQRFDDSVLVGMVAITLSLILVVLGGFLYTVRLHQRQKRLADMKQDFVNNMTHEFKTPISTISLATQALGEPMIAQQPEKRARLLNIISSESHHLARQVERVLQLAELERTGLRLSVSPVTIHTLIESAAANARLAVEAKNGTLLVYNHLPKTMTLMADALHLDNVLTNLLDNAMKYTEGPPHILLKSYLGVDSWVISVEDKGLGMNPDQVKRIFQSFYRVPTGDRHDVKGFGLGLAYTQQAVEAHGGTISVDSTPGVGSAFTVVIPVSNASTSRLTLSAASL